MPAMILRLAAKWLVVTTILFLPARAHAQERYFLIIYGAQHEPNSPKLSHTFATVIRTNGPDDHRCLLEAHTISWLPQTLRVRFFGVCPEAGMNFGLHETLRWALSTADEVSLWGPFEIQKDLYDRALVQISVLESGQVRYKCVDGGYNSAKVSNCIHAVTTLASGYRTRIVSPAWGDAASYYVTLRLHPWIINPCRTYRCLLAPLGVERYPIRYQELDTRPPGVYGALVELFEGSRIKSR